MFKKCDFSSLNLSIPNIDFLTSVRQQSIWLAGKCLQNRREEDVETSTLLLVIGCGTIVVAYFQVAFWSIACERQTRRIREILLRAILKKEIAYFDINKTGQLSTRLTEDVNKVHDGTGDKLGSGLQFFAGAIAGLVLGYRKRNQIE